MQECTKKCVGNQKYEIVLRGRIDSSNSEAVGKELNKLWDELGHAELDMENLEYISSAGLRLILSLVKKNIGEKLILKNVSRDLYEIFEMTGFTELVNIKKAYRKISIDGLEAVGNGAIGKVYKLDEDTIVKVFVPNYPLEEIQKEQSKAKIAFSLGVPTAIAYDIVKIDQSYGVVFEMVKADTLANAVLKADGNWDTYYEDYLTILKIIHQTKVPEGKLRSIKEMMLGLFLHGQYSEEDMKVFHRILDAIPDTNTMIHGDFHPGNIMIQNEEFLLIDMATLSIGHPLWDFFGMKLSHEMDIFPFAMEPEQLAKIRSYVSYKTLGTKPGVGKKLLAKMVRDYALNLTDDEFVEVDEMLDLLHAFRSLGAITIMNELSPVTPVFRKYVLEELKPKLFSNVDRLIALIDKYQGRFIRGN